MIFRAEGYMYLVCSVARLKISGRANKFPDVLYPVVMAVVHVGHTTAGREKT
jgi:hypothetical protein